MKTVVSFDASYLNTHPLLSAGQQALALLSLLMVDVDNYPVESAYHLLEQIPRCRIAPKEIFVITLKLP
jgi:hypothetical protein